MYDPQVDALGEKTWRAGPQVATATFVGRVPTATYDGPWHIHNWGITSTQLVRYEAPAYTYKSNQLYPISKPGYPNIGTQQGQAPGRGIYTGVPNSGCSPSGTNGGNPYS